MNKRCGCSYMGGCICPSLPEPTFQEKLKSAISEVDRVVAQGIDQIGRGFEHKEYKLKQQVKELQDIISASKITDVRVVKHALQTQKDLAASWKKNYDEERKIRSLLLSYHPQLQKAYQELDDKEFITYTKQYFKELKKDK